MQKDVRKIVLEIASYILKLAGMGKDLEENKKKAVDAIESGIAYAKFKELVEKQNGDISYLENIPKAKYIEKVIAEKSGYVSKLNAEICGKVSIDLGARKNEKRR